MTPFHIALTFGFFAICHFIADFLLQPSWMAKDKSEKVHVLIHHVLIHFFVFAVLGTVWGIFILEQDLGWSFRVSALNTTLHAVIDWNVWRTYKSYVKRTKPADFKWWEDHWFYVVIGADQLLHGLSLVLAFVLATR